jgi:hypothetical protein
MPNSSVKNASSDYVIPEFQKESLHSQSHRKSLLTEESFNRLAKFQTEIFSHLEMTPSFRKIINALISNENLEFLRSKYLKENSEK